MKSFLVYKFLCAGCSSSYIGKTFCHFKNRIEEQIKKYNKPRIFKHLHSTKTCFDSYSSLSFKIIDKANSKFDLKIKDPLHMNWRKLNLNAQQNHSSHTFTVSSVIRLFLDVFFFFVFSFHPLFHECLTVIINTFYCLNYN